MSMDRMAIPGESTRPQIAIGVQGSPDPTNRIQNIAFPPSDIEQEAGQIAALAQANRKKCPANLFHTWTGQAILGAPALFELDFTPAWWVVRMMGSVGRAFVTLDQGGMPPPIALSAPAGPGPVVDLGLWVSAQNEERVVLPGESNRLWLVNDPTGGGSASYSVAALGGDYDPSKVY